MRGPPRRLTDRLAPRTVCPVRAPTAADQAYLDRRRAGAGARWLLPPLILVLVVAVWIALFTLAPSLVNPRHVIGEIEQHAIEAGTLTLYAIAATLLANAVLFMSAVIAIILLMAANQERRYLRMLERLAPPPAPQPQAEPPETAQALPPSATTSNDTGA